MESMKRNFLWNAFGNVIYLGFQWLVTVMVARLAGFEDAGILSLAMSVSAMFQQIALFGIRSFQVSDIEEKYSDSCYTAFRLMTCGAAMVLCMVFSLLNSYDAVKLAAIFWFMLFRLAEDFSDVLHGTAQRRDRLDIAGKAFAIKGVVIAAAFFAAYLISNSLNISLMTMALASCATTLIYDVIAVRRLSPFRFTDKFASCIALGKETLPLCVYLFLFAATTSTVPKYILEKMTDDTALGAYSSIYAPALLIQAAAGYIYSPFIPQFAQLHQHSDGKGFRRLIVKISAVILAVAALVMVAALFLGEFGLKLLFGEEILAYSDLLLPILISTFVSAFMAFFCMLEVVIRSFRHLIAACAVGLALCLGLTPVLINSCGINGASYGLIAGATASVVYLAIHIIIKTKDSKPTEKEVNS